MLKTFSIVPYHPSEYSFSDIKDLMSLCLHKPNKKKIQQALKIYQKNHHLYLGILEGTIMALVGYDVLDNKCKILHLAVRPDFQKQGIAKWMIEWMSYQYNRLEAETDNEALGFYQKVGFSVEYLGEIYPGTARYRCFKQGES